jgi:hypothetical protein
MYHPPDILVDGAFVDNGQDEYIELYNLSPTTTPLYDPVNYGYADGRTNTWRLRGAVDFNFPMNISMGPGAYLLIVNFDPNTNTTQLAAFRSKYDVPPAVPILGPYRGGKLQNGGASVELYKPDPPQSPDHPDAGLVPYIFVDRVKYSDSLPWPVEPDGTGAALQRIKPEEYGNDPINWMAAPPSPGRQLIRIESVQRSGGATTIRFNAVAYSGYTLQYSTSLGGGGTSSNIWSKVSDLAPQPTTAVRSLQDATTNPKRFYRIVTPIQ